MAHSKIRKQRRGGVSLDATMLRHKVAEALARGSFQKAREWARELYHHDPSPEHCRWLMEATVGRAAQLRLAGQTTEAVAMLRTVVQEPCDSQELLARYARELMLAGDWQTAEQMAHRVTDTGVQQRLDAARVDAVMVQGESGLLHLPEAIRPMAQRVLHVLTELSQGKEGVADAAVADMPRDAPLHDWHLLAQGLRAFYSATPAAAVTLWQQLAPERAPAAMAAPFRAQIDREFLLQQPQSQQAELLAFGRRFHTETWLAVLEDVRNFLAQDRPLPAALRRAREALRVLPPERQDLRQRLGRTMYWEVVRRGTPRDLEVYTRLFGAPADDPALHRLQALGAAQEGATAEAQEGWAAYEQDLAQGGIVSAEDAPLARSLVWCHMGELAEADEPPLPGPLAFALPPDSADEDALPFAASTCYRRSIELAPQYLQAHEQLLDLLHTEEKPQEIVSAAQGLLEHFPEHQQALEALADAAFRQDRWDAAVAFQERAVRARPHDTNLTARLDFYRLGLARLRAQQGHFEAARALLVAQLEKATVSDRCLVLCRLAAVEFKAGQRRRGEELFAQAGQEATSRLVAVFKMLRESLRMPLDRAWTKKLDKAFRRELKGQVDMASAVELLSSLYAFQTTGTSYRELPEHQQLILQYLKRARQAPCSEEDLQRICMYLQPLADNTLLLDFAMRGCREFPQQPEFPFLVAAYYLSEGPETCPWQTVQTMLHTALDLAQANPAYAEMVQRIEMIMPMVQSAVLFADIERHGRGFGGKEPALPDVLEAMADIFGLSLDEEDLFDLDDEESDAPPWASPNRGTRRQKRQSQQKRR